MKRLLSHLPNALSAARIPLALLFPFVGLQSQVLIVALAALTDMLDGPLARRIDQPAPHGNIIDPIADKTFVFVVFITLIVQSHFGVLEFVAIALRDLSVIAGSLALMIFARPRLITDLSARWSGKLTTVFQFTIVLWLLILGPIPLWLLLTTAALSALAGIDYIASFIHQFQRAEASPSSS